MAGEVLIPFVVLLALVAVDRLVESGRLQSRGIENRWRRGRGSVIAYARSAPATYTYAFVLLITTWVLQTSSATIADRLLLERSTNLHHLAHDPMRVVVASAFWLPSAATFLLWLLLLTAVAAPFEHRVGSGRTVTVFALGHVLATLLTAVGLWAALRMDVVESSVANAKDVGASYGFLAIVSCMTFLVDRRLRTWYAACVVALVVALMAISPTFTNAGHLLAAAIGFACYPVVRNKAVGTPFGLRLAERLSPRAPGSGTATNI